MDLHDDFQPVRVFDQPLADQVLCVRPQPSALSSQLSALSSQLSALSPQPSALSYQLSALSPQLSALSPQLSALSPRPSALGSRLSALSPQLSALSSQQGLNRTCNCQPTRPSSPAGTGRPPSCRPSSPHGYRLAALRPDRRRASRPVGKGASGVRIQSIRFDGNKNQPNSEGQQQETPHTDASDQGGRHFAVCTQNIHKGQVRFQSLD